MRYFKSGICLLLMLCLLTGCAGHSGSEDFAVSDQLESDTDVEQTPQPNEPQKPQTPVDEPSKDEGFPNDKTPSDEPSADEPAKDQPADQQPKDEPVQQPSEEQPKDEPPAEEAPVEKTKLGFMSLNIRHSEEVEPNTKAKRLQRMGKLFAQYRPAVIGMQEIRPWWMNQMEDTDPGLPDVMPEGYKSICYYRNEREVEMREDLTTGSLEGCVIYYDTGAVTLLKEGVFWLSTHPNRESKFETSKNYRITVWAKFKVNATGEEFYYYSTHLDTEADTMIPSVECINSQIAQISKTNGKAPVIVCGDFNFSPDKPAYPTLQKYFTDAAAVLNVPTTTFSNWGYNPWSKNYRIDYFLSQGDCAPVHYEVDTRVYNPDTEEPIQLAFDPQKNVYGYYSDHAPLYAEYELF